MNISIDGRGINLYKGTGIGTYTENIVKGLLQIDKKNNYYLYWSGENQDLIKGENLNIYMTSKKYAKFFEEFYFTENVIREKIEVHHIPQNGIGLSRDMTCPIIVTIHDLIPYILPETVGKGYLVKFLNEMPEIIKLASKIITVSEFSKNDILRFFPNAEGKVFVTPLATSDIFTPMNKKVAFKYINENYKINSPFILYVGGFSKRKNVITLIHSFKKLCQKNLDVKLVIAGSLREEGEKIKDICKSLNLDNKVIFTGFVDDISLSKLYNCCEVFVYPSLYEGFGLPPLEAMSCGTAVISSNLTSIPEVLGDSGILIDPLDIDLLCNSLLDVLLDKDYKKNLEKKAMKKSLEFSWNKTALKTLEIYNKAYEKK